MDAAVQAAKQGADKALATATDALPAAGAFLSRATYKTCYAVSFSVVFPAALIASWVPKNNPIVHGLIDGAQAARDWVDELKSRPA
jgi:hypothetical protein